MQPKLGKMLKTENLQQKMALFLLLPVAGLLITMGWLGYLYAEHAILKEWQEAAILRLQDAAHEVDMRLAGPKFWMQMFGKTGGVTRDDATRRWIVARLDQVQGVEQASLIPFADAAHGGSKRRQQMMWSRNGTYPMMAGGGGMMNFKRATIARVEPPHYDARMGHETVSLVSNLLDTGNRKVGQLKVDLPFNYLLAGISSHGWKQEETASLIDDRGDVLTCSSKGGNRQFCEDAGTYQAVLKAMRKHDSGTLMRERQVNPDDEVIGYYRLKEAPWTLVLTAQSGKILASIDRFRMIFLIAGTLFTIFILLLIRMVAGRVVASIREVSQAAQRVAEGDYQVQLVNDSSDEVGQLIRSFNTMVLQLEERMRLKAALDLAMEVQQNLLPGAAPQFDGLDIAGTSVYCDETGGDYYDFLEYSESGEGRLALAIGDVAGHGISAALRMTTARAMLRTRILQSGNLGEVVTDVNRLLCYDTDRTGDFMTLFLMSVNVANSELHWVRAGHVPGIIYDWELDAFEELRGEGMALGVMADNGFTEYRYRNWSRSKLLFLGTDGIWETRNPQGEQFGTARLRAVLRRHSRSSSQQIVDAVLTSVKDFSEQNTQEDDITMVVLKSKPHGTD